MKKYFFTLVWLICSITSFAQISKSDEIFTKVETFEGKVVFIKEIKLSNYNAERNYAILKEWGKTNYARDPFNSSINYDDTKKAITAQSRIELLLPENSKGIREKIIMKYRLNVFFKDNLTIMEITNVNYINDKKANGNTLDQKIKAENMITDKAVAIDDANQLTRLNTRKNTLYFFNDLSNSLKNNLNN